MRGPTWTFDNFSISSANVWTLTALFLLLVFALLPFAIPAGAQQQAGLTASLDPSEPLSSPSQPPAPPHPFWRLVATGAAGLLITAAHLAHNFRRFLGLGVFTNVYSFVLLALGAGISGVPVTSESTRVGYYLSHNLSPWILNFMGVIITVIIPAIGRKTKVASSTLLDFEGTTTSNPLLSPIVDGISERVRRQMKTKLVLDCNKYSWEEIKRAACIVLTEETTFQRLKEEQRDSTITWINSLQPSTGQSQDCDNKYNALVRLLGMCPFSRLHAALAEAHDQSSAKVASGTSK